MPPAKHPIIGVGALVFHNHQVLLVKRRYAPNAGQWAIPGGKQQFGETLQQTAEREIFEETGIRIRAGKPVYTFEFIEHNDNGTPERHYVVIDLASTWLDGTPAGADDALDARWFRADELNSYPVNTTTLDLLSCYTEFVHKDP